MKKSSAYLVATVLAVSIASSAYAQTSVPSTSAAPEPAPQTAPHVKERHPQMHHARKALENAKKHLQDAKHDYNGHRTKALELVDQAIQEIDAGVDSVKK